MKSTLLGFIALVSLARSTQTIDLYKPSEISEMQRKLSQKAGGFASRDFKDYGNHYTMLAYRASTGSSEIHEHEADIFVVEEGDGMIVTGGKLVGGHQQKPGELRGTAVEGGETRSLKTGDIVHIPAGVPHQILVSAGKPITYFVVKVRGQ